MKDNLWEHTLIDFRGIEWIESISEDDPLYEELAGMSDTEIQEYYNWLGNEDIELTYIEESDTYYIYPIELEDELEEFIENEEKALTDNILNQEYENNILNEYIKIYKELDE